ncbi:hypothetical protein ACT3S9_10495 [Pseudoalteromonas sp. AOP31-A2-14]|uniref:hypothetical protein n=1 Tax=Pseudoalteromonas sp. AOP31-A2-14 TaxID=3457695 RepID=UPI0040358DCA
MKVTDAKQRSIRANKIRCQPAKIIDAEPAKLIDARYTDGDGVISQAEASIDSELMSQFTELDTDQNGELSEDEFSKA